MLCAMLTQPIGAAYTGLCDQRADSLKLGDWVIVGSEERKLTKIVNKKDCFSDGGSMFDTGGVQAPSKMCFPHALLASARSFDFEVLPWIWQEHTDLYEVVFEEDGPLGFLAWP